jgi:hypothetical protein
LARSSRTCVDTPRRGRGRDESGLPRRSRCRGALITAASVDGV